MKVPTVSVVIPTDNYGHFISRAIDSILEQSFLPEEIIVIDDGSIVGLHLPETKE